MNLIKFFANDDPELEMAWTNNIEAIQYNIDNIDRYCKTHLAEKLQSRQFLFETIPVFQWICVIVTDLEEGMMVFIDGNLEEGDAMAIYKNSLGGKDNVGTVNGFIQAYFDVKNSYYQSLDKAELVPFEEGED